MCRSFRMNPYFGTLLITPCYYPLSMTLSLFRKIFIHILWLTSVPLGIFSQDVGPEVRFRSGSKTYERNIDHFVTSPAITPGEWHENILHRYIQFEQIPDQNQQNRLEQAGIRLVEYIPHNTYLVALKRGYSTSALVETKAWSVITPEKRHKMDHRLVTGQVPEWARLEGLYRVAIIPYDHVSSESFRNLIINLGFQVDKASYQYPYYYTILSLDNIDRLAALPWVRYIELGPVPAIPEDIRGRTLQRANRINNNLPGGLRFDATGVNVMVRDDGAIGPHIDFEGRVVDFTNNAGGGTHGDGVAGVFAGAGNLDPDIAGSASGANIYVLNYNSTFTDNTIDLHLSDNVVITNSSYSDDCNAGYTTTTQRVDQQMMDHPTLMHVFSAGNSNGQDCGYGAGNQWGNITGGHKQGKNVMAVANLHDDGTLVSSSSRGPAHDGRIKPDIAAHGQGQLSTSPDNNYQVFGGTSAAAPTMAGTMAQLYQVFREKNGSAEPEAALLKGVILNSAFDMGNPGPDYKFGWGRIDAYQAYKILDKNQYQTSSVNQGSTRNHQITVFPGVKELKVMLYWHDPAAAVNASTALVNDLDLEVIDPAFVTHDPWLLDPTPDPVILDTPAGKGSDHINNMEQVSIVDPPSGFYNIRVQGNTIPSGLQDYWVNWCFLYDDVTVTYPLGGESLEPGEQVMIHWDAYNTSDTFDLDYSTDNGNTWNSITSGVAGTQRLWLWNVPSVTTAEALIRVTQGGDSDVSDDTFSILASPSGLIASDFCLGEINLSWNMLPGADEYIVYQLGEKYMEEIGRTDLTELHIHSLEAGEEYWFAVRGIHSNGTMGKRSNAVPHIPDPAAENCRNTIRIEKIASSNLINAGDTVMYTLKLFSFYDNPITNVVVTDSLSPSWNLIEGSVTCGTVTNDVLTIGPVTVNSDDSLICSIKLRSDLLSSTEYLFTEDIESGATNWNLENILGDSTWHISSAASQSPEHSWFSPNSAQDNFQRITLQPVSVPEGAQLSFFHSYDTEFGWDGGFVEISTDNGSSWTDLGPYFTMNGYNSVLGFSSNPNIAGKGGFSGSSGGFIQSVADLSAFAGQNVLTRFSFGEDDNTSSVGWYLDDIEFSIPFFQENRACVQYDQGINECALVSSLVFPCQNNCDPCTDGIRNRDETGIDCGGSFCGICPCTSALPVLTLQNVVLPHETNEKLDQSIIIQNGVSIGNNSLVELSAGEDISVSGPFTANASSSLVMSIEDCQMNTLKPSGHTAKK